MEIKEITGTNAGKVWQALNGNEGMTITQLKKATGVKQNDLLMALGWLTKEGKLDIDKKRGKVIYRLV